MVSQGGGIPPDKNALAQSLIAFTNVYGRFFFLSGRGIVVVCLPG